MQHVVLLLTVSMLGAAPATDLDDEGVSAWEQDWSLRFDEGDPASVSDLIAQRRAFLDVHGAPAPPPPLVPGWPPWIEQWRPLVVEYFESEDVELGMAVIACESSGDPKAVNPKSDATGLWQHLPGYWKDRWRMAGLPGARLKDPVASTIVAAWLLYNTGNGWDHWSCARHLRR